MYTVAPQHGTPLRNKQANSRATFLFSTFKHPTEPTFEPTFCEQPPPQ